MVQPVNRPLIVGVMGGGSASSKHLDMAEKLGELIAESGFILLNGGRDKGIMEASAKGAFRKNGTTIGILPGTDHENLSSYIKIPIITGMGNARNQINILSSDIVIAFKGGPGTISEIAFALKFGKIIILMDFYPGKFIDEYLETSAFLVDSPNQAMEKILKKTSEF